MKEYAGFEQGPIRPPSEAFSLLVRVNRNCPWNRCTFCSIYKKKKFSLRPEEDVIRDIDKVAGFVKALQDSRTPAFRHDLSEPDQQALYAARNWIASGMESVFLQDADGLAVRPDTLIRILRHLRETFPGIKRITSYARSDSVLRFGGERLREVADAGLNRLHVGMESASDTVLGLVRKGVTKETHVKAGIMAKEAGMELSEYVLSGLGGSEFSTEHAVECADALNQINPDFIRFRNLHLRDSIALFPEAERPYRWASDLVLAREIHTVIERLEGITSRVVSDHSYNLLMEIDGVMPHDKERLLAVLRQFIEMPPEKRVLFQVGKRSGHFTRLGDMNFPGRIAEVEEICRKEGITPDNADEAIHEIVQDRMRRGMPF